ncbi:MAG: hypothetical protein ACKVS6_13365 [Planctomycetota bacterium]
MNRLTMTRIANMALVLVTPVFIVLCVVSALPSIQKANLMVPTELEGATLDELIGLLPHDADSHWDETTKSHIFNPAVLEMHARLKSGRILSDTQWRAALLNSNAFRVRNIWPASAKFAISMRKPAWLGLAEIRVVPPSGEYDTATAGTLSWDTCGMGLQDRLNSELYQDLGPLGLGRHLLVFDVTIESGEAEETGIVTKILNGPSSRIL